MTPEWTALRARVTAHNALVCSECGTILYASTPGGVTDTAEREGWHTNPEGEVLCWACPEDEETEGDE